MERSEDKLGLNWFGKENRAAPQQPAAWFDMTHERSRQALAVPGSSVVPLWKVTGSSIEGLQEALTKHPGDLLTLSKHCNFLPSFSATCLSVVSCAADVRRGAESWAQKRETKANPAWLAHLGSSVCSGALFPPSFKVPFPPLLVKLFHHLMKMIL